jgi:hypothetical protein
MFDARVNAIVRIGDTCRRAQEKTDMAMGVMGVPRFERFFRSVAELDVDKDDLKRFNGFVFEQIYDMLIRAEANAKANLRDTIEPWDLPITKGLQERIHEFEKLDDEVEVEPFLEDLVARPQLDVTLTEDTIARLPYVAGGLSVALARSFKIIDPKLKNPSSEHWDRVFALFELLM